MSDERRDVAILTEDIRENIYFFRFVIHLPTLYNNGKPIETEKIDEMLTEIQNRFTGYTKSPHLGRPIWEGFYRGPDRKIYRDRIFIIMIDAPDSPEVLDFFNEFKLKYKDVFDQSELYIVYHSVTKVV